MLKGKKIILGITGSIAAYKAAFLVRLFVQKGAEVRVIMTPVAEKFISPLTLATLSGNPVRSDLFEEKTGEWTNHVEMGLWADLILVAPATANTIAKMAHGHADNLLLTVFLSARCPIMLAPAMDLDMYGHSATQKNLEILTGMGVSIIDAATGELASGLSGKGRMEDPERILKKVEHFLNGVNSGLSFSGKKIMITAGPTYENIDPVRFIGNYSSGKMGIAIADSLAAKGADVHLVLGPVGVKPANKEVRVYPVVSAKEMFEKCLLLFPEMDGAVMAAAVSDFTPSDPLNQKTKRGKEDLVIRLKPTRDIAAALGEMKTPKQWLVGFALETQNESLNAQKKLEKKNLDLIVLNSLNDEGAGFGYDTNKITIIDKSGSQTAFKLKTKKQVAEDIVDHIHQLIQTDSPL